MHAFLAFLFGALPLFAAEPPRQMATLGDSLSTGAITHPDMAWDPKSLDELIQKPAIVPPLMPTRVWEPVDESQGYLATLAKKAEQGLKERYIGGYVDLEENSWGFLLGRKLQVDAKQILVAGEIGTRSSDAQPQAKRLLRFTGKALPSLTFVGFTGNDACGTAFNSQFDFTAARKGFAANILKGLKELLDNGDAVNGETATIFVMGHLPIADLMTKEDVLDKEVFAFGENRTCRELRAMREGDIPKYENPSPLFKTILGLVKRRNLPPVVELCKNVLSIEPEDTEKQVFLRNLIAAYRLGAQDAVEEAKALQSEKYPQKKVRFQYLKSSEGYQIEADDVAVDCFHLSPHGQEKLAQLLFNEIKQTLSDYE
ncbi:hypothetical protein K2X33_03740 [bacterium]|nr:hypothetical protein [bacterium]